MSYLVLARKWRPRRFADLVGQEHVVRALVNALDSERLHHAYLFSGTRGVGKTTIARILAKALNCDQGVRSEPCGECGACTGIDEGRFVDLIEVDAASKTRIDDTRELLDNVQYAPAHGRFKVYLIDEVHMLSTHSFNALLKTLEEPPPHVKFLLATTDPRKLPVTVLSRCLQFNLTKLTPDLIAGRLREICQAESVETDAEATALLARSADGSMRDALSLLDQAIAYGGGAVRVEDLRNMMGTIDREHVLRLLGHLATQDGAALLEGIAEMDALAPNYEAVVDEMLGFLQRIAVQQIVPAAQDGSAEADPLADLAERMGAEDVQLYYQIGLMARQNLKLAPDPRGAFEMLLLRMLAFRPIEQGGAAAPQVSSTTPSSAAKLRQMNKTRKSAPPKEAAPVSDGDPWTGFVDSGTLHGAVKQMAANCTLAARDQGVLRLRLDPSCEHLNTDKFRARLGEAASTHFGEALSIELMLARGEAETPAQRDLRHQEERRAQAREQLRNDPNVKALKSTFDAEIAPDSIEPVG